jgi:hypothetical protein
MNPINLYGKRDNISSQLLMGSAFTYLEALEYYWIVFYPTFNE